MNFHRYDNQKDTNINVDRQINGKVREIMLFKSENIIKSSANYESGHLNSGCIPLSDEIYYDATVSRSD